MKIEKICAEGIVTRGLETLFKERNLQLEKLLVLKLLAVDARLIEDRTDPQKVVWTIELDD